MSRPLQHVPFSALQAHLGGQSRVAMVHAAGADHEFHRTWECGCKAVYRDTQNHTARWLPCKEHAGAGAIAQAGVRSEDAIPRILTKAGRRSAPQFLLLDNDFNVVAASGQANLPDLVRKALHPDAPLRGDVPTIVPMGEDHFLRVVPLEGQWAHLKMIFVESTRGSGLANIAKRFELTNREIDVLRLLISSKSNTEIASELCIAESTVGDHVKNIFRKMKSTRRTQVITKLFESPD